MGLCFLLLIVGVCWAQHSPNTLSGRTSIVHLFEWRWADIALECERYLAPNGFGGVQISPPNENVIITDPRQPWWERYQPISYKLCTRSGNETEFRDMVTRCNDVGVHIYVDAVINHMCGANAGAGDHATCGSYFSAKTEDFPAVPYSGWDFNDHKCKSRSGDIEDYHDISQVRDCRLVSLLDLALEKDYVRSKVAEYLNYLIDIGVAGFRIDAAKHMWPGDLKAILDKLKDLNTKWFSAGSKPFIYQEVIDLGGEPIKSSEYFGNGRVTEFKYGAKLGTVIRKWNGEKMAYLKNWGEGWGFMPSDRALVFVDNHDNQRGHGAGGASILTFWDARLYKMAVGFMLAHPYGFTRVMSSFRWPRYFVNGRDVNDWVGPPSNSDGSTKAVTINPDTTCGNDWVCEHRWRQIKNMVIFRNVVDGQPFSNWWDNGSNQVAFGRGNKGFIVFNNDDWSLNVTLQTGLPAGTYCDVISGQKEGDYCTALEVHIAPDGMANFLISNEDEDPFIAIHVDAKFNLHPTLSPSDVFEQPQHVGHKKIEFHITTDIPAILQINSEKEEKNDLYVATEEINNTGFGRIFPAPSSNDKMETEEEDDEIPSEFISRRDLEKNRLSREEMEKFSVFKNYEPGDPNCRIYVKNLAKQVQEKDLKFIFGRYVDFQSEVERNMFDIRLMKEGRMKGQAFIGLPNEKAAAKALKEANGYVLFEKPMVVQFARSARPKQDANEGKRKK